MNTEARLRRIEQELGGGEGANGCSCGMVGVVLESQRAAVERGECPRCGGTLGEGFAYVLLPDLAVAG